MEEILSTIRKHKTLAFIKQLLFLEGVDHRKNSQEYCDAVKLVDAAVSETAAEMASNEEAQMHRRRREGHAEEADDQGAERASRCKK